MVMKQTAAEKSTSEFMVTVRLTVLCLGKHNSNKLCSGSLVYKKMEGRSDCPLRTGEPPAWAFLDPASPVPSLPVSLYPLGLAYHSAYHAYHSAPKDCF